MQALLTLQPRTASLLALTTTDNVVQARYELERARDFGNVADLAAWAQRWGPSALDTADDRAGEIEHLESALADAEQEAVDAANVDTDALVEFLGEVRGHLTKARAEVVKLAKTSVVDDLDEHLDLLEAALADAVKEANRL